MFQNEPFIDFSLANNRANMSSAIANFERRVKEAPYSVNPIIAGREIETGTALESVDPATPSDVLGEVSLATVADAEEALQSAREYMASWSAVPFADRAQILRKVAAYIRAHRLEINCAIIKEAGKPWVEADVEVAEAIDFCEYYADEMLRLGPPREMGNVPGEANIYFYQPRGVVVVIAPWNFPFAIACGMTAAALVTGNCVVFKPAEQTSIIGYEMVKAFLNSGLPPQALSFLPGWGEDVGRYLVNSPLTDMVVFTGSRQVGLEIVKVAGHTNAGQVGVKRVVAEMGGKNAIIVDDDADLDEAVKGVVASAFGYAGQKCSACSRVLAVGDIYERFMERLCDATKDIIVGAPKDPATFLGPVIDEDSQARILATISEYSLNASPAFSGEQGKNGFYVPATIFRDVPTDSSLWRDEIFGPVLACRKVDTFEQGLAEANSSEYALTGGVFSRNPSHISEAYKSFKVGNLYINRKITGALVYRQPFGGFRMSGIGSKAGGPDYLIQFMEPRVVTENTLRRGFVP